jgi:hypothetical protein
MSAEIKRETIETTEINAPDQAKELSYQGMVNIQGTETASTSHDSRNTAQKGADFEHRVQSDIFKGKGKRLTLQPEDNHHLDKIGDGVGITKNRRISDIYWSEDKSLWELKSGYENSTIDRDQLEEYNLMERAGYVYTREGDRKNKVPVASVNYLFESKKGAEHNKPHIDGYASTWYLNEKGDMELLK